MHHWNFLPNVPVMLAGYADAKVAYEVKNKDKNYDEDIFVIAHNIIHSDPYAYLQLGVYWWAVKKILKERGLFIAGDVESPALAIAYTIPESEQVTIYAAFAFRDWFIDHCFIESREHVLDNDTGETYILGDADHEASFQAR